MKWENYEKDNFYDKHKKPNNCENNGDEKDCRNK
jgi:hypothetical protein